MLFNISSDRDNPTWDGGLDRFGIKRKSSWKKISNFLKRNQIDDVYGFIYANLINKNYNYSLPNSLYSAKALATYSQFKVRVKENFYQDLCNYVEMVKCKAAPLLIIGYTPSEAIEKVLLDAECPVPPLFRVLLALKYNLLSQLPKYVIRLACIAFPVYKEMCDKHDYRLGEFLKSSFPEFFARISCG